LAELLIDQYRIVVNAPALGEDTTMFDAIKRKLTKTRAFSNGDVVAVYEPG